MKLSLLMFRSIRCVRPVVFAAALLGAAAGAVAAPIPPAEKLLPDDTLVMFTVPDFAKLRTLTAASPQTQAWNDPAMKPFRDKFMAKLQEQVVAPLERELGAKLDDYTSLPQGQLTFAVTQNGWQVATGQAPAVVVLMDARDKSAQLKKNLADLRKKWLDAGKTLRIEKIRDTEFSIIPLSSNNIPKSLGKLLPQADGEYPDDSSSAKPASRGDLVIGQFDSLLIAGNSVKAIEKIMVHLTGGAMPSLGELASYESSRLQLFRDSPAYGWVNLKAFIDIALAKSADKQSDGSSPFEMFSPEKLLPATGVSGLKTFAFAVQYPADGCLVQAFLGMPESTRAGLFKIAPVAGKDSAPPAFVPATAVKFQRTRIDGQKAWATLQSVMNDISPQLVASMNFIFETANTQAREKDPAFDIRKNFFGNLGDDFISYSKAPRGDSLADLGTAPWLMLIGSPQAEQLSSAIKSLLVLINPAAATPTEREFLGRKIYSIAIPGMMVPGKDPAKPQSAELSYAASGGYLAITIDPAMIEEYLRSGDNPQKALRETAGLSDAAARVGGFNTGWFGFENQSESVRVLIDAVRKSAGTDSSAAAAMPFGAGLKDWLDFSLLPPYEKISKYFGISVYSISENADGASFKMFAPTPGKK
ncbi:MAG: hypothetical protein U1F98_15045 [Verrucomicrobiota bacterium]